MSSILEQLARLAARAATEQNQMISQAEITAQAKQLLSEKNEDLAQKVARLEEENAVLRRHNIAFIRSGAKLHSTKSSMQIQLLDAQRQAREAQQAMVELRAKVANDAAASQNPDSNEIADPTYDVERVDSNGCRRPQALDRYYSEKVESWDEFRADQRRKFDNIGRKEETDEGEDAKKPCDRCRKKGWACRVYTDAALVKYDDSDNAVSKCAGCVFDGRPCSIVFRPTPKRTARKNKSRGTTNAKSSGSSKRKRDPKPAADDMDCDDELFIYGKIARKDTAGCSKT